MKTVVFVLQKSQFSAVIGNERCFFHGAESMSLSDSKPERIVGLFENNDDFKGWNDTKLFILYDSESKNYLSKIIEYFGKENKVLECEKFSFQIKLEENPVDFESGLPSFGTDGDAGDSVEIDKLKREIKQINAEIDRKNIENDELNRNIAEKDSEINSLKEEIKNLKDEIAPKDDKIKELQKWYDDWDCYAAANIISDGKGHLELKKPIGDIHKIYFYSTTKMPYYEVAKQLKNMNEEGSKWRFPTEKECGILKKLFWIPSESIHWKDRYSKSKFFPYSFESWFVKDGYYRVFNSQLQTYQGLYEPGKDGEFQKFSESYRDETWSDYVLFVC